MGAIIRTPRRAAKMEARRVPRRCWKLSSIKGAIYDMQYNKRAPTCKLSGLELTGAVVGLTCCRGLQGVEEDERYDLYEQG